MRRLMRLAALTLFAAALIFPQASFAENQWRAYDGKAFAQAQRDGKTIFVHVHAHW